MKILFSTACWNCQRNRTGSSFSHPPLHIHSDGAILLLSARQIRYCTDADFQEAVVMSETGVELDIPCGAGFGLKEQLPATPSKSKDKGYHVRETWR
ncbi:MAG: hypothetical protein IVW54_08275 [Candidatus Binataceae bacterium]|nr:hypothetical protein [Candidatus Binataceae bacterium]